MYQVTISSGNGGGVFILYADRKRVQHEIRNLPDGWRIHIWDVTEMETPIKCRIEDF